MKQDCTVSIGYLHGVICIAAKDLANCWFLHLSLINSVRKWKDTVDQSIMLGILSTIRI